MSRFSGWLSGFRQALKREAFSAPGTVYAETQRGFFKSADYGNSWSRRSEATGLQLEVNPANADELLMIASDGLSKTTDGGQTWTKVFNGTVTDFAVKPSDFNRIIVLGGSAAGVSGLHKTTDGGSTWALCSLPAYPYRTAYCVAVDPADDGILYVGGEIDYWDAGENRHIYGLWVDKSMDGGVSWTSALYEYGSSHKHVRGIHVDPASPNRIFVRTDSYLSGLYRSEDYGATWQVVLPDAAADVEINPAADSEVHVAVHNYHPHQHNGVWESTDWGGSWQQMNSGLTTTEVEDLAANWTDRILYVGTVCGGVLRTFLPGPPARPTISGVVKTAGGQGMPGVQLTFSNGGGTVTTGVSGYYVQPVPVGWSGTVTPSKADCIFAPADRSYANVTANQGGEDYTEYVHTVSPPTTPNGLPRGEKEVLYTFSSGGAACTQGHNVEYQFDWGDGSSSGWSSAADATHSWSNPGNYTVKVQARCVVDVSLVSAWSSGAGVTILTQYTEADKHAVGDFDGDGLDEAAVDFGTLGVWLWNGGLWSQLTASNPEHLIAGNLDSDGDDEIIGDFGPDGIWAWNSGSWGQLSGQNPEIMVTANIDGDAAEELVVDLGNIGAWLWNGGNWSQITDDNPEYLTAANADGDAADELATDMGSLGLWLWNGGVWTQLTEDDPEYFIGADTDNDSRDEIVADFGALGLWLWNGGAWTYLSNDNPEFMAAGDTYRYGPDEVAADFGGLGVFLWNAGNWSYLTPDNPDFMLAVDVDGDGAAEIVGDFGALGVWLWKDAKWTRLTSDNPQYLTRANTDGDADQEFIADFGPLGLFLWNNNAWTCLTDSNPE